MRGVADGDAFFREKIANRRLAETLAVGADKMLAVIKENEAEDAPHIVLDIRIIKIHCPTLARRRETAEHEQARILRGKRREWVGFAVIYSHHKCLAPDGSIRTRTQRGRQACFEI